MSLPIVDLTLLKYNLTGEYAALLLEGLLLIYFFTTRPRQSAPFKYLRSALINSLIALLLQITIGWMANYPYSLFDGRVFNVLIVLYLIAYGLILIDYSGYIVLLCDSEITNKKAANVICVVIMLAYMIGIVGHMLTRAFWYVESDGINISHFIRYYCVMGITCTVLWVIFSILRREYISRIVMKGLGITIPIIIGALIFQLIDEDSIFTGMTYVAPLLTCFILFHDNPYDEDTGCQNANALESRIISDNRRGKIFYIGYIEFPQLMGKSQNFNYQELKRGIARTCREIERISGKIHLYRINIGTFVALIEVKERSDAENYSEQIRDYLDEFYHNNDRQHYFFGVGGDSRRFSSLGNKWTQFFIRHIKDTYSVDGQNVYYFANGDDFKKYNEIYIVEEALADIRANMDIEDERILCYAQPIYSVDKDSFRTAETLMRLQIDGRVIPPDEFIPIAERSNCIHALTVIMMHKVCRAVEKLAEEYDFDAVTINCSTADFVDREFYKEIMDIIHSYNVDNSKIRLELTESMMAGSFDAVKHNMDMLHTEGIQLYIDDFGTGYSNLERVLDVPAQTIKFDKSLLYKSLEDDRVGDIISYMIDIFKKNGFVTLVEGVEDETQRKYSVEHGFDYIQGYHYAKPMPIGDLGRYFDKR